MKGDGTHDELREINLGTGLLDHQILDVEGFRCGNVDDIVLTQREGVLEVSGVLVGSGVVSARMPSRFWRWVAGLAGESIVKVPWICVRGIDSALELAYPAASLGLGAGDRAAQLFVERFAGTRRQGGQSIVSAIVDGDAMPMLDMTETDEAPGTIT